MKKPHLWLGLIGVIIISLLIKPGIRQINFHPHKIKKEKLKIKPERPKLNQAEYDRRLKLLSNVSTAPVSINPEPKTVEKISLWPPKTSYPKYGAILPFHRVVAYYGNYHSTKMGIIGEYPEEEVLKRLAADVAQWNEADPMTPVIPAIHYVAVTAQGSSGADGKYRLRMADKEIDKVLSMARKANGIAFLDIQVGRSTVQAEVPQFDHFLKLPQVHLGLDPEFSMKNGAKPGQKIGVMDAAEINWTIRYLSKIVDKYDLPPKILVIHRFTPEMISNIRMITPTPQVQVVINMDGWGTPQDKVETYRLCVTKDPVQFSGFKIFYKNDLRKEGSRLISPKEVLSLTPKPIYIQYQ